MKKIFVFSFLIAFTILTGCSQSAKTEESVSENAFTVKDFADREVTFNEVPKKIVPLGNGDLDIIYALGGEAVGRPNSKGDVPEQVKDLPEVGTSHELDLEQVAILQPDVVLGETTLNAKDVQTIEGIGSKMLLSNANSVEDIYKQIELYGAMLQKEEKASEIIEELKAEVEATKETQPTKKSRVLIIYGAPGTYMVALPNSLSGNILELAGGTNIAANFQQLEAFPQYAQLNSERIVEANPEYVWLMTHGNSEEVRKGFIKEMERNPAWNSIDAVINKNVEVLPSDLFGTNPGTKVTDAIVLLQDMLKKAE